MYAPASRDRRQEDPGSHNMGCGILLRAGESREDLGSWLNSGNIHEAKRGRAMQVITCSFPCGKWLHMIRARASSRCELCRGERKNGQESMEILPEETVTPIRSARCKAQRKSVIGAHNNCWKYLLCAMTMEMRSATSNSFEVDKDRQFESLWKETKMGDVLPWEDVADEAEKLLTIIS
jgi:hypothetical protein